MAAAAPRRRKLIGHRRRVEDEGEDEVQEPIDLDDDSMSDNSLATDDDDAANDSDTSNIDEASPTSPNVKKMAGNGATKSGLRKRTDSIDVGSTSTRTAKAAVSDTDIMLNGLPVSEEAGPVQEINFEDSTESPSKASAPIVVSSSSASQPAKRETTYERQRREHDLYRQKRDEDPSFVPNRGAFFMHDHRGAGPSANGFRPFPRGARGRGRGGIGGPFAPFHSPLHNQHTHNPMDPTTNSPWSHDMHEAVVDPQPNRHMARHTHDDEGPPNGDGVIPTRPSNAEPINRTMSVERALGAVRVRVFFPPMKEDIVPGQITVMQYTKLPDHRPPLRRDKPVRISLPNHAPRYVFPAVDRSFIFIPRAMRPNQQRMRGKPRSGLGSVSGFSRRTSVFGGSYYGGSMYSPSIALSRRSSIAPDMGIISPTGSAISRPPLQMDASRPVVRLPPPARPEQVAAPVAVPVGDVSVARSMEPFAPGGESSINDLPQPQTHPLPQKPTFQENRPTAIPMHQPRPQKAVSVETIESPTMMMPFHQQMPLQVSNGFASDTHNRNPSYPSHTTGTPLSQIPERAIHAAPFQPTAYSQPGFYGQGYPMMQPQQGFFYPPQYGGNMGPSATAAPFVPGSQQQPAPHFNQPNQGDSTGSQASGPAAQGQNLVAQEVNGMVYYYDASQLPTVAGYQSYTGPQGFVPGVGMGGTVTPSPDGFYYPQAPPGMVHYYQQ